ncbi:MAG: SRPBCC family protein [Acidimicrobiales bacterium]
MNTKDAVGKRHGSAVISLPSDTEYLITRVFDAPAELVFKAYTTPDLVKRWWGFETSEWLVCDIDLREGGGWRYVTREGDTEVGFHGEYREIARPHRLVFTETFEGVPEEDPNHDAYVLVTMTLDEVDGVTTMTQLVQHPSQEVRDAILATGMESGMQVSFDRLEDLVRQAA